MAPPGGTYSEYTLQSFLAQLALTGSATAAADAMHIHRSTLYRHRQDSPTFGAAWAHAIAEFRGVAAETLEGAVIQYGQEPAGHADRKLFLQAHDPAYAVKPAATTVQDNRSLTIIQQASPQHLADARALAHAMLLRTSQAIDVEPSVEPS